MKHLKRVCAGMVLTLAFSLSTFAGQMPCEGIADPPPPSAAAATEVCGEMTTWIAESAMSFLLSVF
jgi:hypothetical protein